MSKVDDLPCGACAAGVYSEVPILKGMEMFGHCTSKKQALKEAPRCKHDSSHICFGARDWIISSIFPITEAQRSRVLKLCGEAA